MKHIRAVDQAAQPWQLEGELAAMWTRLVAMQPEAVTVVVEGAIVDGQRVWLTLSAPAVASVTLGHARVLEQMAIALLPDE